MSAQQAIPGAYADERRKLLVTRAIARGWLDVAGLDEQAVTTLVDVCEALRRRS